MAPLTGATLNSFIEELVEWEEQLKHVDPRFFEDEIAPEFEEPQP